MQNFNVPVWVIEENKLKRLTYGEYLLEHWMEEVTTTRGVEGKFQTGTCIVRDGEIRRTSANDRENLAEEMEPENGDTLQHCLFRWGHTRFIVVEKFDTEAEVWQSMFSLLEKRYHNSSSNTPMCYFSKEEGLQAIIEDLQEKLYDAEPETVQQQQADNDAVLGEYTDQINRCYHLLTILKNDFQTNPTNIHPVHLEWMDARIKHLEQYI